MSPDHLQTIMTIDTPLPSPFGVLWDLDGTIVDTFEAHYHSWEMVLPDYGIELTPEKYRRSFGMTNAGVLGVFTDGSADPRLVDTIAERKEEAFREVLRGRVRAYPGVREWLERLLGWGARQALASSAPSANIDLMLDELGIRPYFMAVVSGADLPSKPAPDVFLKAAGCLGVRPDRCVVFEDAVAGVQAAKRAGMRCVAVTTTNPAAALHEADLVVDRLSNLGEDQFKQMLV